MDIFKHNNLINESTELTRCIERLKFIKAKKKLMTKSRHESSSEGEGFHCIIYGQRNEERLKKQ